MTDDRIETLFQKHDLVVGRVSALEQKQAVLEDRLVYMSNAQDQFGRQLAEVRGEINTKLDAVVKTQDQQHGALGSFKWLLGTVLTMTASAAAVITVFVK